MIYRSARHRYRNSKPTGGHIPITFAADICRRVRPHRATHPREQHPYVLFFSDDSAVRQACFAEAMLSLHVWTITVSIEVSRAASLASLERVIEKSGACVTVHPISEEFLCYKFDIIKITRATLSVLSVSYGLSR